MADNDKKKGGGDRRSNRAGKGGGGRSGGKRGGGQGRGKAGGKPRGRDRQWAGSKRRDDGPIDDRPRFDIVCEICGTETTVPFEPKEGRPTYCSECYKVRREKLEPQRSAKAPRKRHGTRVMLNIDCAKCGKPAELDYMPKGKKLSEVMCHDCLLEAKEGGEGTARWERVAAERAEEQKTEWAFDCAQCGREDYLKKPPESGRDYLCYRCFKEHAQPGEDPLKDAERVGRSVYVRKSKSDGED